MISILVPVYNYDIRDLASELNNQISVLDTKIEVIFYDDFSTKKNITETNKNTANQFGFTFYTSDLNRGIAEALNYLSTLAKYDWLIYLDADVVPVNSNFIEIYIQLINDQNKAFCGGLLYQEDKPKEGILRWKYGQKYEVQTLEQANKNPYLNFKTCNFLIHKSVLGKNKFKSKNNLYGNIDTLFGLNLKQINIDVFFIENRVYHYGLEDSITFLNKTDLAIDSVISMYMNKNLKIENTRLIKFYLILKKGRITNLCKLFLENLKPMMLKNLKSNNPSVNIFQLYKLYLVLYKMSLLNKS